MTDGPETREVTIDVDGVRLDGTLTVPPDADGTVVFAHGSGSSRFSPRNREVADVLAGAGFATLLFDLLTEAESRDRANVFDVPTLARRLAGAIDHVREAGPTAGLPVGLFGASTGAAAALDAAAARPDAVTAVVSRGGRPDLAERRAEVACPVLLVVGAEDHPVIGMNESAAASLSVEHDLVLVPGAGHLFEGPGQLEEVARVATDWFGRHLAGGDPTT